MLAIHLTVGALSVLNMSIEICVGKNISSRHVHWLPSGIDPGSAVAHAHTKQYFDSHVSGDGTDMKASFRGRELDGQNITFPENYEAYVLNETRQPLSDEADRKFHVDGKFKEMTYWNWNKKTSKNDPIQRAMEWIDLAEVLHEPIKSTSTN